MHLSPNEGRISPSSTIPDRLHCVDNIKNVTSSKTNLTLTNHDTDNVDTSTTTTILRPKKVGVLTAGHISDGLSEIHGSYLEMYSTLLQDERLEFVSYDVENNEFPECISECDAYLLSGSVNSANDQLDWINRLITFIQNAYNFNIPLVGICFGHQLIARSLGGKVETHKGGYAAGVRDYVFNGTVTPLIASHGDQVVIPPPDAQVIGNAPYCPFAALRYGDRVFSVQPHPEFTAEFMDDLLQRLNFGPESKQRKLALKSHRVGQYIKDFLLLSRDF